MQKKTSTNRQIWRAIYPLLTYNGISYLVSFIMTFIIMAVVAQQFGTIGTSEAYQEYVARIMELSATYVYESQTVAALIAIPILLFFMKLDKKRRLAEGTWKVYEQVSSALFLIVPVLGLAAAMVGNNLILLSGLQDSAGGYADLAESFFKGNIGLELLGLGVIIPVAEELVFRGLMYERLKEFMSLKIAVVTAAVCFGLAHGNLVQAVFSICLGLLMIYVYERYHSLWAPILFHVASNVLAVIQSETGIFDKIYTSYVLFYGVTLAFSVVLVLVVMLIERRVQSEEILPFAEGVETEAAEEVPTEETYE